MRATHFHRWGIRPVSQQRLTELTDGFNEAIVLREQIARLRGDLEAARTENAALRHDLDAARGEANSMREEVDAIRNLALGAGDTRRKLDVANATIAHLRRVETAYHDFAASSGLHAAQSSGLPRNA